MPKKFDTMDQTSEAAPQFREDQPAPGYENKTPQSWVTGKNEDATTMPNFDHSKPQRRK